MKTHKEMMLNEAKETLTKKKIEFVEHANGHLKVGVVNYWATSGKWYDPTTDIKGLSLPSLLNYLKQK